MKIDFTSNAWLVLQEYLKTELERLRGVNDSLDISAIERGALLGEIRLCKRMLALPEKARRELDVQRAEVGIPLTD